MKWDGINNTIVKISCKLIVLFSTQVNLRNSCSGGGLFLLIVAAGCYQNSFAQCATLALTSNSDNPNNSAWFSDYNKNTEKLHVSGGFGEETFEIGSYELTSLVSDPEFSNAYLMQVDKFGQVDWVKPMGAKYSSTLRGRLISVDDGVISAFGFNDTAFVEGVPYITETEHVILSKYDLLGNLIWLEQVKSDFVQIVAMATDEGGSVYVLGNFYGSVIFSSDTLQVAGNPEDLETEIFLAKLNEAGQVLWLEYLVTGPGYNIAESLSYSSGKLYGCGQFRQEMDIGQEHFVSSSLTNGFLFSMDTTGGINWSSQFMSENAQALAVTSVSNQVSVVGVFKTTMTIGAETLSSTGGPVDGFMVNFDTSGAITATKSIGGIGSDVIDHIELISESLYLASGYSNSSSFEVDGLQFINVANEPGAYNQNQFALILDSDLKADCIYYTESTNSSLGLETNFNHINADSIWIVSGFYEELLIGDTVLYSNGGSTFVTKTCMGCDELIALNVPTPFEIKNQFTLSPNPATQTVSLSINATDPTTLTITNVLGKEVYRWRLVTNSSQLNISHLVPGIYSVTATTKDGQRYAQKLVVQ